MKGSGTCTTREVLSLQESEDNTIAELTFSNTHNCESKDGMISYYSDPQTGKWRINNNLGEYVDYLEKAGIDVETMESELFDTRKAAYAKVFKIYLQTNLELPEKEVITDNIYRCKQNKYFSITKSSHLYNGAKTWVIEFNHYIKGDYSYDQKIHIKKLTNNHFEKVDFKTFTEAKLALAWFLASNNLIEE